MKTLARIGLIILFAFGCTSVMLAQNKKKTRILFIFDASNSMNGVWEGEAKITVAQRILEESVNNLRGVPNLELALRMYGHQSPVPPQDCNDTKLEVPFGADNHSYIISKIKAVMPKGTTPIARSLEYSADDFPDTTTRNVIILITDGIEACDEDPCAVAMALRAKGVSVKPFVVGLGIDTSYLHHFDCIGTYFNADSKENFEVIMKTVMEQAVSNTTVEIDLLDTQKKPAETNVSYSLYDQRTGILKYSYLHTLNYRGNPDTIPIDPLTTYKLVVHTIPQVEKGDIKINPGEHNIVAVDAPQGSLMVKQGSSGYWSTTKVVVRSQDGCKILNVQDANVSDRYIVDKYDVEVLTLPRMTFDDVSIDQSKTTTLQIPRSGILEYAAVYFHYGAIFKYDKGIDEWVVNLDPEKTSGKFELLPGKYKVVWRQDTSTNTVTTRERIFNIRSGETTTISF